LRAGCNCTGLGDDLGVAFATHRSAPCDACFALGSASARDFSRVRRLQRLGLGSRSLSAVLANDPVPMTGERASMEPAVVAYRLLQLKNYDVRAQSRASILASRRGPQPSSCFVPVVTRLCNSQSQLLAGDWARTGPTGREPRAPVDSPRDRFFPVRGFSTSL